MNDESRLTDDEAQAMLTRLSKHFHQPVMPAERFCEAFTTWFRCIQRNVADGGSHGAGYASALDAILLDIRKSSLLARLIYGGEKLRTRKCPEHKGVWSGIDPCEHGCGETGWVPDDWPTAYPRCSVHKDAPAVARSFSVKDGEMRLCYECYQSQWRRRV